jgi:hypothetical protein
MILGAISTVGTGVGTAVVSEKVGVTAINAGASSERTSSEGLGVAEGRRVGVAVGASVGVAVGIGVGKGKVGVEVGVGARVLVGLGTGVSVGWGVGIGAGTGVDVTGGSVGSDTVGASVGSTNARPGSPTISTTTRATPKTASDKTKKTIHLVRAMSSFPYVDLHRRKALPVRVAA